MTNNLRVISPVSWIFDAFAAYGEKVHSGECADVCAHAGSGMGGGTNDDVDGPINGRGNPTSNPTSWRILHDDGLGPVDPRETGDGEALWITPELLIANNCRRGRHHLPQLMFSAPAPDWMDALPARLLGRRVVRTQVAEIRSWEAMPEGLGQRPWSQLSQGRVAEFRAARRSLSELKADLAAAPKTSSITVNAHVPGIVEEWCVIVHGGRAVASCGYCLHNPPESHHIVTVFDDAGLFHEACRGPAEASAAEAAQLGGLSEASIIVGFQAGSECGTGGHTDIDAVRGKQDGGTGGAIPPWTACRSGVSSIGQSPVEPLTEESSAARPAPQPLIIEAAPVWCTAPYPFETQAAETFLDAIADSRLHLDRDGTARDRAGSRVRQTDVYSPDPWMLRENRNRFR